MGLNWRDKRVDMELTDEDVANHESGHWVIGAVNGFPMGFIILIPSSEGGFSGRTGYKDSFSALTTNELRRAAIRTCLAGEAARGVRSLEDFSEGASGDIELARKIAGDVDDDGDVDVDVDEVLGVEFERTVQQVEAHAADVQAVVGKLMATASPDGEYRSLTGISAAKAMGWSPVRDVHNAILRFDPNLPA